MPGISKSTNQYRWLRRLSVSQSYQGAYAIWRGKEKTTSHDGIPILQQSYIDTESGELSWLDVPVELETEAEAQKRCDAMNARRDAAKKKDGGV